MSILLSRVCVVPTWFVVVGLVALSSPLLVPDGVLLLGAVIVATAVLSTFALRRGPNASGAKDILQVWRRGRDDRAALLLAPVTRGMLAGVVNRSRGQASRGLGGLRHGSRGRA